jgi:hypothetical protein
VVASQVPAFWSFCAPLATSVLKSGHPGLTTPGIFRPWAFSSLRRFTPSGTSPVLFHTSATCGVQRTERVERDPRVLVGSSEDIPSGTRGTKVQMTGVIYASRSRIVVAPFFPSICPSRFDEASMRHSPFPRERGYRRRAHRPVVSLRIDHVKGRPLPQLPATFPSFEERS